MDLVLSKHGANKTEPKQRNCFNMADRKHVTPAYYPVPFRDTQPSHEMLGRRLRRGNSLVAWFSKLSRLHKMDKANENKSKCSRQGTSPTCSHKNDPSNECNAGCKEQVLPGDLRKLGSHFVFGGG